MINLTGQCSLQVSVCYRSDAPYKKLCPKESVCHYRSVCIATISVHTGHYCPKSLVCPTGHYRLPVQCALPDSVSYRSTRTTRPCPTGKSVLQVRVVTGQHLPPFTTGKCVLQVSVSYRSVCPYRLVCPTAAPTDQCVIQVSVSCRSSVSYRSVCPTGQCPTDQCALQGEPTAAPIDQCVLTCQCVLPVHGPTDHCVLIGLWPTGQCAI